MKNKLYQLLCWQHYLFLLLLLFPSKHNAQIRHHFAQPKMGTTFQLIFYTSDTLQADSIATQSFARIDQLNNILSDYLSNSEVSQLSESAGSGDWIKVSDELWTVLTYAQSVSKRSKGAFDVSIGPLSKLWRRAFRQQQFPDKEQIKSAKRLVNYKWIKLEDKTQSVRLKKKGMRLDLGGIAKGYTVDEVMKVLNSFGIHQALVDGGGDLSLGDPPPEAKGWKIQSGDSTLLLSNIAIATSGSTYQYLEWNGKRYSHIIHPKTGLGVMQPQSVSVQATTCMEADAWASVFSVTQENIAKNLEYDNTIRCLK